MAFITALELVAVSVDSVPEQFAYERDPDDAHYVNLALAPEAEVLVSRDSDLLALADGTSAQGAEFRSRFPGLRISDPVAFLRGFEAEQHSGAS